VIREERGPWYLLTGLILGVVIGLYISIKLMPVEYVDTAPATLRADMKDRYRALIAAAFAADGDLPRAQARLGLLQDPDTARLVAIQAQRALAEGPESEAHALGLLAVALSSGVSPVPVQAVTITPVPTEFLTETVETVEPIATTTLSPPSPFTTTMETPAATFSAGTPGAATATPTLGPTRTPTPASAAPFVLEGQPEVVCSASYPTPMLIVEARDAAGNPFPGAEVVVTWAGGEEHFFTGLKPDLGLGYADFDMVPGTVYTVRIGNGGEPVGELSASQCPNTAGNPEWGSLKLIFVQP
jgi:hypothetical protein